MMVSLMFMQPTSWTISSTMVPLNPPCQARVSTPEEGERLGAIARLAIEASLDLADRMEAA